MPASAAGSFFLGDAGGLGCRRSELSDQGKNHAFLPARVPLFHCIWTSGTFLDFDTSSRVPTTSFFAHFR